MRYFRGYTEQDFRGVLSEPNIVLGVDVFLVAALRYKEAVLIYQQVFDQAKAEIFQLCTFFRCQVPHAIFVNELVGLNIALFTLVTKTAWMFLLDGSLQLHKLLGTRTQVFVCNCLHMRCALLFRSMKLFQQVAQAVIREQMLRPRHSCIAMQVLGWNTALRSARQLPMAIGASLNDPAQALAKVAFNGAHIHLKILCKLVLVNRITLVQARKNLRQALCQFFAF